MLFVYSSTRALRVSQFADSLQKRTRREKRAGTYARSVRVVRLAERTTPLIVPNRPAERSATHGSQHGGIRERASIRRARRDLAVGAKGPYGRHLRARASPTRTGVTSAVPVGAVESRRVASARASPPRTGVTSAVPVGAKSSRGVLPRHGRHLRLRASRPRHPYAQSQVAACWFGTGVTSAVPARAKSGRGVLLRHGRHLRVRASRPRHPYAQSQVAACCFGTGFTSAYGRHVRDTRTSSRVAACCFCAAYASPLAACCFRAANAGPLAACCFRGANACPLAACCFPRSETKSNRGVLLSTPRTQVRSRRVAFRDQKQCPTAACCFPRSEAKSNRGVLLSTPRTQVRSRRVAFSRRALHRRRRRSRTSDVAARASERARGVSSNRQDESPSRGLSLNRSQRGNCSTEYNTPPGT